MDAYEVARVLGIHYRTVHRLRKAGELRGRAVGGQWRFTQEDVQSYLDAHASVGAVA